MNSKDPKLLQDIENFLKDGKKDVNFEAILTVLTARTDPELVPTVHYSHDFWLTRSVTKVEDLKEIIDSVYDLVCDCCLSPFRLKPEDLEEQFRLTYDPLIGLSGGRELIFSTNYDPSVELWCQKRFLRCADGTKSLENYELRSYSSADLVRDFRNLRQRTLQNQGSDPNTVMLARLHGSIMTYQLNQLLSLKLNRPKDGLVFNDLYDRVLSERPSLIFPGQEHWVRRENWADLYQEFIENLVGNCLFIGYSFRHDMINDPILDHLRNGTLRKLCVLAPEPEKNLRNLFRGHISEDNVVQIPAHFGTEEAIKRLNEWFPLFFHPRIYPDVDSVLKAASDWRSGQEQQHLGVKPQ